MLKGLRLGFIFKFMILHTIISPFRAHKTPVNRPYRLTAFGSALLLGEMTSGLLGNLDPFPYFPSNTTTLTKPTAALSVG